jgi:hypothetical protein
MRDRETIDSELRLLAAVRWSIREHGGVLPAIGPVDELLDGTQQHRPCARGRAANGSRSRHADADIGRWEIPEV